eukprot:Em0004g625a
MKHFVAYAEATDLAPTLLIYGDKTLAPWDFDQDSTTVQAATPTCQQSEEKGGEADADQAQSLKLQYHLDFNQTD